MLKDGYGVLVGTLAGLHRDNPDNFGRWYHVHLSVSAQNHTYDAAIDVDSHQSNTGVEWKVIELLPGEWLPITGLAPGVHALASNPTSGALDYIRDPRLRNRLGCAFVWMPEALLNLLAALRAGANVWQHGSHVEATQALESILEVGRPVFVFGEPFHTGFGMHNVHQNQGDPLNSQWSAENGIWQDGGTLLLRANGSLVAFISKFTSQAYETDDQGHPKS
jgi:hypothetical protein